MRRDWPIYLAVLLLLALLGGWIAVSRYPDSPAVAAAEDWPLVGGWVGELRRLYLPPEAADSDTAPAGDDLAAGGSQVTSPPAGGVAQPAAPAGGSRTVPAPPPPPFRPGDGPLWLAPGDPLRARPEAGAEVVAEADAFTAVPVLERNGRWRRVRLGGREGWVLPPERAPGEPPLGRAPAPPLPLPSPSPDPARLAAARALLSDAAADAAARLGPHPLYSDADPLLIAYLDRVAAAVESAYVERYRRRPVGTPAGAVVLFAREADYRAFQAGERRLTTLPAGGHASGGLVALWAGGRRRDDVAATLVHELTHLLNLRALGPALPPWLDEGLANDLGWGEIGAGGALDPERLGGAVERDGLAVTYHGPRAALRTLAETRAADGLPRLSDLAALDWEAFVRSPGRDRNYALAGFLIRYLLAGEDGALAPRFHGYLAAVADGGPATGEALLDRLGLSWDSLQQGFERWLIAEATAEAGYVERAAEEAGGSSSS